MRSRRLHTHQKNTRIPTPEPSTAPAQAMFQPRPFGNPAPTADANQQSDLKISLVQAERYGHHLSQMHDTDVSVPQVMQPKMGMGRSMQSEPAQLSSQPVQPSSGGRPLPKNVQQKMEAAFSTDFADVRVHEGAQAKSMGADAYAQGNQIHFQPGKYDPTSESGQQLLGHELTHVVQQRAGQVAVPQGKGAPINSDPKLEQEADNLGAKATQGEQVQVAGAGSGIQRQATSQLRHNSAPVQLGNCSSSRRKQQRGGSAGPASGQATAGPTSSPATAGPASGQATAGPTSSPATAGPTSSPATAGPTSSPATAGPTSSPATAGPTSGQATAGPTSSPAAERFYKESAARPAPTRSQTDPNGQEPQNRLPQNQLTGNQFIKDFGSQSADRADADLTKKTGAEARPNATQEELKRPPEPMDEGISDKRQSSIPKVGFHSTTISNSFGIMDKGLDPKRGGIGGAGAALGDEGVKLNKASKDHVHYTDNLSTAGFYSNILKEDGLSQRILGVRNPNPRATEPDPRDPDAGSYRTKKPISPENIAPLDDPKIKMEAMRRREAKVSR